MFDTTLPRPTRSAAGVGGCGVCQRREVQADAVPRALHGGAFARCKRPRSAGGGVWAR